MPFVLQLFVLSVELLLLFAVVGLVNHVSQLSVFLFLILEILIQLLDLSFFSVQIFVLFVDLLL